MANNEFTQTSNAEFSYKLLLADRMEQLVNNEYLADVVFLVGAVGEIMFGHKLVLTVASEVFYAQFNGNFEEAKKNSREHPIVVKDIEPSTFQQILRFMYCEQADVNTASVVDIYYASQKYMLTRLNEICENFFQENINESNALKILNDNARYAFAVVAQKCLIIIRDNPLYFFKHEDFFTLEKRSLELIIRSAKINCQKKHLLEAIANWIKINELQFEDGIDLSNFVLTQQTRTFQCLKLHSYSNFCYVPNAVTDFTITVQQPLSLYGFGIFIKSQGSCLEPTTVNLIIKIEKLERTHPNPVVLSTITDRIEVPVTEELYVQEVVFEKLTIDKDCKCRINVKLMQNGINLPPMFCLGSFKPIDVLGEVKLTTTDQYQNNCISHLLYNVKDFSYED